MLRIVALIASLLVTSALATNTTMYPATVAINTLGLELLFHATKPDQNVLLSPYSIQSALAMTYAGADGVTSEEMAKALHYPQNDATLHGSFAMLREALDRIVQASARRADEMKQWGADNEPTTLMVANRLFGQSGYDFREPFLALVRDNYAAPFETLDFIKNAPGATKHINVWVGDKTRQRINNVIPEGALDELTRLVLVNAIYLKSPWQEPFKVSETKPGPFHIHGASPVDVPMMKQRHEFAYRKWDGYCTLTLPYRDRDLMFLLILPDKVDGLASVEKALTPDVISGRVALETRDVTLYLPKFKLEPPLLKLSQVLQRLGMKTAFDQPQGSANFDRIAPRRPGDYLAISEVFHKTFLNLDERGTEAAAATAVVMMTRGIHQPQNPIEVRVDHPFLFAIQHRASGACLFLGRVVDPR